MPMNRFQSIAFVEEVHDVLYRAANADNDGAPEVGPLTEQDETRLIELEEEAEAILTKAGEHAAMRIIRNDAAGPSEDPKAVDFNTLAEIDHVEVQEFEKVIEHDGELVKVPYKIFTAFSKPYKAQRADFARNSDGTIDPNGGTVMVEVDTRDSTRSGPEGFIKIGDEYKPFGAASALLARLLEARGAGKV